jgi:hypothetical protein
MHGFAVARTKCVSKPVILRGKLRQCGSSVWKMNNVYIYIYIFKKNYIVCFEKWHGIQNVHFTLTGNEHVLNFEPCKNHTTQKPDWN